MPNTPYVPECWMIPTSSIVARTMLNEFTEEESTKPELTESMAETLERLRARTSTRDRPSIRQKSPTLPPGDL
jgi:hypothetical protein